MSARFWLFVLSASAHYALAAWLLGHGKFEPARDAKKVITLLFAPSFTKGEPMAEVTAGAALKAAAGPPKKAAKIAKATSDFAAGSKQLLGEETTAGKAEEGDFLGHALRPRLLNGDEVYMPYPPKARYLKVEGSVHLMLTIAESGEVKKVIVVSGPAFGLRQAAINLARKLRFSPALDAHGNAVVSEISHEVIFRLKEER